ncbi:hypothetical protein A0257_06460 [Hymenobacter psoromatis]|nr:hypothetical protein A0257_06460 [Hymenobacter psoromatis]
MALAATTVGGLLAWASHRDWRPAGARRFMLTRAVATEMPWQPTASVVPGQYIAARYAGKMRLQSLHIERQLSTAYRAVSTALAE